MTPRLFAAVMVLIVSMAGSIPAALVHPAWALVVIVVGGGVSLALQTEWRRPR